MTKPSRLPSFAFLLAPLLALGLALPAVAAGPAAVVTPADGTAPHAKKPAHRVSAMTQTAPAKPGAAMTETAPAKPGAGRDMPASAKVAAPPSATTAATVPPAGTAAPKTN